MKKCPNCGAENPDEAKYCVKCGADLSVPPGPATAETPGPLEGEVISRGSSGGGGGGAKSKWWIWLIIAVVAVILLTVLCCCGLSFMGYLGNS